MLHQPFSNADPIDQGDDLRLIIGELKHRSRNMFTLVQVIATQTLLEAENLDLARQALSARLQALGSSYSLLGDEQYADADIADIFEHTVRHHLGVAPGRVSIYGPALRLPPRAARSLAMAFHELATNALKYGALSNAHGIVSVRWHQHAGDRNGFRFEWREHGGPAVAAPTRSGFGSDLIRNCLVAATGGKAQALFASDGVIWTAGDRACRR